MNPLLDDWIERVLPTVEKPSRYMGSEYHTVEKVWEETAVRIALAYPDMYEVGMSHLGLQILYHVANAHPRALAERVFCPGLDMEARLRRDQMPLFSLESRRPLSAFDMVGITLQYELTYSNILNLLDLAGIPLRAVNRISDDPLIVAGGPCAFNVEPMADFFDLVVLGDGEEVLGELIDCLDQAKAEAPWDRAGFLRKAATIEGVYVPSGYEAHYNADGDYSGLTSGLDFPSVILKRRIRHLDDAPFPTRPVMPYAEAVHDRAVVELFRGCERGCRFCMPGMVYRPVRERSPEQVKALACEVLAHTGYDELSLVSLSSSDYTEIEHVLGSLADQFEPDRVSLSLPSLRVDRFSVDLAEKVRQVRNTGLTLAPEAGTQRLRDVINKQVTAKDYCEALERAFAAGVQTVKLYFMIGLPTETDEDVLGVAEMVELCRSLYRAHSVAKRPLQVNVSVAGFIPKPHTPFQWEAQLSRAEFERRFELLRQHLPRKGVKFSWHDPEASFLEAVMTRGDRRLGAVIEAAFRNGARFDGWTEHFQPTHWQAAFSATGVNPEPYAGARSLQAALPWDHLQCGISASFLRRERERAYQSLLTETRSRNTGSHDADRTDAGGGLSDGA